VNNNVKNMEESKGLLNDTNAQARGRGIVSAWLLVGLVLVLGQIVIGGITRLTDSGLSMTEWKVVEETIPPLTAEEWDIAFEKYRTYARHQYTRGQVIIETVEDFKRIYFWEWFHRLWAKSMGFIFLIPFLIFLKLRYISSRLLARLGVVILLAASAAVMGWVMVRSGLQMDEAEVMSEVQRTRVSAYRLIIHLVIATALMGYLWWTYLSVKHYQQPTVDYSKIRKFAWIVTIVLVAQILVGGLVAGTKAGLVHPHFPAFVNGGQFVEQLTNTRELDVDNFVDYERSSTPRAWIQLSHRLMAYLLTIMVLVFVYRLFKTQIDNKIRIGSYMLIIVLITQITLGAFTIINYKGGAPLVLGVLHQAVALILLCNMLYVAYLLRKPSY
jgi:cytochrome c oxidase assembly protein subunit 15